MHAKVIGKTFSRSKIFAWSQSISPPPQVFGNYKGKNDDFVVEGLGRNQFSQGIGGKYIGMSDACDVMCPWIQCTEKGLSPL